MSPARPLTDGSLRKRSKLLLWALGVAVAIEAGQILALLLR